MPKNYDSSISTGDIKLLEEIISNLIIQNYTKGDALFCAKKIIRLLLVPVNNLKLLKK